MPGDEVTLDEIYAEVDKRIKAATDALETKLTAAIQAAIPPAKEKLSILRKRGA